MHKRNSGFTLIELLVVISIIGVLSVIIFAALGGAKNSGSDSGIKAGFDQARTQIETDGLTGNDYGPTFAMSTCPTTSNPPDSVFYTDPTVKSIIAGINNFNGNKTYCAAGTPSATGNATSWAIESPVKYSTQWWCVSSSNGPKLSFGDESMYTKLFHLVVPSALAFVGPPTPYIGGGNGTPALCP